MPVRVITGRKDQTMKDYLAFGKYTYLLFVLLAAYALHMVAPGFWHFTIQLILGRLHIEIYFRIFLAALYG